MSGIPVPVDEQREIVARCLRKVPGVAVNADERLRAAIERRKPNAQ
jgi:hypothetical protein